MKVAASFGIAIIGIAGLAGGYAATRGGPVETVVTQAQAAAALAALYDARGDADELCKLGTSAGNCRALLQDAGDAPPSVPAIVCSLAYSGDATHAAGLIVRVHTNGQSADTESLVLVVDGDARYMNPVYWNGARVSQEGTAEVDTGYACG